MKRDMYHTTEQITREIEKSRENIIKTIPSTLLP